MFFSWELFATATFVAGQFMVFVVAITSYRRKMLLLFYNLLELTGVANPKSFVCFSLFFWGIVFFICESWWCSWTIYYSVLKFFFAVFYWRCSTFIRFFCDLVDNLNHFAKKVGDFFSGITSVSVSFMINFSIFLGFFYLFF